MLAVSATPAAAVAVYPCGSLNRMDIIWEPWEQHSKTFYEGQVRVSLIDTWGEPACCSMHIAVLMPPPEDEPGMAVACFAVSATAGTEEAHGMGFSGIGWDKLKTEYDASRGLLISFPYGVYDADTGSSRPGGIAKVRINMAERTIKPE